MTRLGCVHGRFQPFHLGHFEYVQASLNRCDHLLIGITQYDRNIMDENSPQHRMISDENPFTYWERTVLITSALMVEQVSADRYSFVPFPIHCPEAIEEFVPRSAAMFTTIYDDWNREKIARLRACGYAVEVLWERAEKAYSGAEVRRVMRAGGPGLRELVPTGTYEALIPLIELRNQGIDELP